MKELLLILVTVFTVPSVAAKKTYYTTCWYRADNTNNFVSSCVETDSNNWFDYCADNIELPEKYSYFGGSAHEDFWDCDRKSVLNVRGIMELI